MSTVKVQSSGSRIENRDRAVERFNSWPEWKRNAFSYKSPDSTVEKKINERPPRISKRLREELESVLQHVVADRPYTSPDAERGLIDILGYAIDPDGEKVSREQWFSPVPTEEK